MSGYVLEIIEGPDAGKSFPIASAVDIGREAGADIILAGDELVSRRHARLSPGPQGIVLEDLASRNGTFVNGHEVYAPTLLGPGDEVTLGVTVMELRGSGERDASHVRRVPESLTSIRPSPLAVPGPGLAAEERTPDYLPGGAGAAAGAPEPPPIHRLLDVHTKRMAKTAPLAIFVLVAIVIIIALALR